MKYLLFLFFTSISFGQNIDLIDQISFYYYTGGNVWNKDGIYSKSENFDFIRKQDGDYVLSKHFVILEKVKKSVYQKDTIFKTIRQLKVIPKSESYILLAELNTNNDNFTEQYLREHFSKPTKRELRKIARSVNEESYFIKNKYQNRIDIKENYWRLQSFDLLEKYIETNQPKISETVVTNDGWNYLEINIFGQNNSIVYSLDFLNYAGQPITIRNISNISTITTVINLDVNIILKNLIPEKTLPSKELDLDNIRDNYIAWYLQNKNENL